MVSLKNSRSHFPVSPSSRLADKTKFTLDLPHSFIFQEAGEDPANHAPSNGPEKKRSRPDRVAHNRVV